jgi:hypothetical protein
MRLVYGASGGVEKKMKKSKKMSLEGLSVYICGGIIVALLKII